MNTQTEDQTDEGTKRGNVVPKWWKAEFKSGIVHSWLTHVISVYSEDSEAAIYGLLDANDPRGKRWPGKNKGMVRMNAGNCIRAAVKKNDGKLNLPCGRVVTVHDFTGQH